MMSLDFWTGFKLGTKEHSKYSEAIMIFEVVSAILCVSLNELYLSQVDTFIPDSNRISFFGAALAAAEIKHKIIKK